MPAAKSEARALLATKIHELRKFSYAQLAEFLDPWTEEIIGPSGETYQLEVQAIWDDRAQKHLRLMVSIDDRGIKAFAPLTDDFIVSPEGFVGE